MDLCADLHAWHKLQFPPASLDVLAIQIYQRP
jgi:hypothetical protein